MQQLPWRIKVSTVEIESSVTRGTRSSRFKRIVISERNYLALKMLGHAGDSFNDVVSKLLRIERRYEEMKKKQQEEQHQQGNSDNSSIELPLPPRSPSAVFEQQRKEQIAEFIRLLRGNRRGKCSMNNQTSEQDRYNTRKL